MKNVNVVGVPLLILASFLWSTNAPFVKFLSVDAFLLTGMRALIAGLVLFPFFRPQKLIWNRNMVCFLLCYAALCTCIVLALLFLAVIVLVFLTAQPLQQVASLAVMDWVILLYLGIFQIGVGFSLYYMGLRTVAPKTAAMLTPSEMVLGPLWVALFLKEYPDLIGIIGFGFILAGVIGEAIRARYKPS